MSTHADLPGGWRTLTLRNAIYGNEPLEQALHSVGARGGDLAKRAKRDMDDAIAAYRAGDETAAMATVASLAEEIQQARKPGRGAAA
ncbi:hypothetical protein ACFPJ1_40540 [Kribbella qitaiheensis]|uniref:hypothetical protein n=1 Tax=Kribbella qitaiheensis TaxID=1544730 RepID=UPI00361A067B